jgi:hypothetical protein
MLIAGSVGKRRMTGEVCPLHRKTSWDRASGVDLGGRGRDFAAAAAIAAPFRLPVGPEFGYSDVNQGRMDRPYGKCRSKGEYEPVVDLKASKNPGEMQVDWQQCEWLAKKYGMEDAATTKCLEGRGHSVMGVVYR